MRCPMVNTSEMSIDLDCEYKCNKQGSDELHLRICILSRSHLIVSFTFDISRGTRVNDGCAFMLNIII